jgi:valyl-tRNA synthetase
VSRASSLRHGAEGARADRRRRGAYACLPLGSLIDLAAETARLEKAIGKANGEASTAFARKLVNEKFVANAKPEVVEAERAKLVELQEQRSKLLEALARVRDLVR